MIDTINMAIQATAPAIEIEVVIDAGRSVGYAAEEPGRELEVRQL